MAGKPTRERRNVGRAILLGLELLIIADIVMTITVDPTLESAAALGLIVLVRTFLSFSLEIELEGSLPWLPSDVDEDRSREHVHDGIKDAVRRRRRHAQAALENAATDAVADPSTCRNPGPDRTRFWPRSVLARARPPRFSADL